MGRGEWGRKMCGKFSGSEICFQPERLRFLSPGQPPGETTNNTLPDRRAGITSLAVLSWPFRVESKTLETQGIALG